MICSKLYCFRKSYQCIAIIFRQYAKVNFTRTMPRDDKYIVELQKQRKRLKIQNEKYAPSNIYLQVIGNGAHASSRSVLLVTDHKHYLFNCGEGTQRLSGEHNTKLTKIENIFITRPVWSNMGGVPGMALTIQDTGVPLIKLHGPKGTIDIIKATQNFVNLKNLEVVSADNTKQFNDQTMTIDFVQIDGPPIVDETDSVIDKFFHDNINYYDYEININGKRSCLSKDPSEKPSEEKSMEPKNRINSIMIFICKIHPKVGALDLEKCVDAGIRPGPLLGRLKNGIDVTLEDGTVVKSQDVTSKSEAGPIFIVMECPDESWIEKVIENPAFQQYQKDNVTNEENLINYIIHFTPENVLNNSKYKEWMHKFGLKTKHLIINEQNPGYSNEAIYRMQHQLHLIHPTIFPFFGDQQTFYAEDKNHKVNIDHQIKLEDDENSITKPNLEQQSDSQLDISKEEPQELLIHKCQTLNVVQLRPHTGLQKHTVKLRPKEYIEEVFSIEGFLDALADLQTKLNAKTKSLGNLEEYPRILMLGTGSAVPNKIRNTSGILLQIDEESSIIFDCGEGTVGQILKFFKRSEVDSILKSIKGIFVSHLHADHHLGLIGILKERQRVTEEPVYLLAPQQLSIFLSFYHKRFELILDQIKLIPNRDLMLNQIIISSATSKELHNALNVAKISTTFVVHCPHAYGIAVTLKDGRKICYSGDTVPCENLIKLASDCSLLIHEATMEDSLEREAVLKRHSTISQAVNIGVKANAKFTLLTHFSQRYSKLPLLPDRQTSSIDFSKIGIAYDFMLITLSNMPLLSLFYPTLSIMFSEFRNLLNERAQKREWKKEQAAFASKSN